MRVNRFLGTSHAFILALMVIGLWALSFLFNKPNWHAAILEITAILSFINIFVTQRAQNKDLKAIHIKLDELIASSTRASNLLIKAEDAPERVLEEVEGIYKNLAKTTVDEFSRSSIASSAVEHIMENMHTEISQHGIVAISVQPD